MRDRKKKLKVCVYCGKGKDVGPMSSEHVVPKGLWEKKPSGLVTVPAHVLCNTAHAADNEYFRTVIAFTCHDVDQQASVSSIVTGAVTRSMINRTEQFLKMTKDFDMRPRHSPMGLYLGHQPCFTIDATIMLRVLQNIVRCVFYDLTGKRLGDDRIIDVEDCDDDEYDPPTKYFVDRMCDWQFIGDDVFMIRYAFVEDYDDMACLMRFYGSKTFFATTHAA